MNFNEFFIVLFPHKIFCILSMAVLKTGYTPSILQGGIPYGRTEQYKRKYSICPESDT